MNFIKKIFKYKKEKKEWKESICKEIKDTSEEVEAYISQFYNALERLESSKESGENRGQIEHDIFEASRSVTYSLIAKNSLSILLAKEENKSQEQITPPIDKEKFYNLINIFRESSKDIYDKNTAHSLKVTRKYLLDTIGHYYTNSE